MLRLTAGSLGAMLLGTVLAAMAGPVQEARADSFVFGYSSGQRHHHGHRYRHHPHYGHPHFGHHHRHHRHYRPHYWSHYHYHYRPPVIVSPPPVIYRAPPQVIYQEPPVVSAVPSSPVYQAPNGQYCREYQGTVTVNGRSEQSYGTACLMPDGTWRVVN
jgi:hypothetical protein